MRDRAEVEKAIGHLRQALSSPLARGPEQAQFRRLTHIQIELLLWATGEENSFADLISSFEIVDAIERAKRQ